MINPNQQKSPRNHQIKIRKNYLFWGELIDKYKDINANSKTVFTDYTMLKLVHIVPICFYYSANQRWAWLKKFFSTQKTGT